MITREERVLRVINGDDVDYLPSQITFSDRTRDGEISRTLGLSSADELDDYLDNHLYLSLSLHDKPLFYRDDREEMQRLCEMGYCYPDWDNKVVYDSWGMGIEVDAGSFYPCFHPLEGKATEELASHMPPDVDRASLFQDIEQAVAGYHPPDNDREDNFSDMEKDLEEQSGDHLVIPSGYFGVYERAYAVMGFGELMTNISLKPKVVHELLDKVADQKVEYAKRVVQMGFKVAHHGDDLGTQKTTLMSKKTFHEFILPRIARVWNVYNSAGIPIIMHSCGCLTDFIPDLIDAGLRVLEPVQPCMDLAFLKREYGKDLVFYGGIETQ
ncbi:MAG TPA: uroporphyrinogen decarboxylase family protein, partial [Pirellulales bacterium]|nr:uroporphyrinogen decarboxylase family protein [Pirellulales bacterium]